MVRAIKARPQITDSRGLGHRLTALEGLLALVRPVPKEWLSGPATALNGKPHSTGGTLDPLSCSSYRTLIVAWRKALRWTDGLDHALAVMLASVASVKSLGDQLWIKIIGPAACGKSTLCEALSVNTEHVIAKSTIRGFHSGYKSDGEEDNSLAALLFDKTLITKDGDTLLQSPNLPQILAEGRDIYDGTSRTHYRNKSSRDYAGLRMTWILCGTSSLRSIDSSELGERFLDCVIMEKIDEELEDEVIWRIANRADRNMALEADGKPETHYEPELVKAMQLTGGYIEWLKDNASDVLTSIETPDWALRKCTRLGKLTAFMRARPSMRQEETAEREFASRLVSQYVRLAKCLAMVLNRSKVDKMVMGRVARVAMDTSRGQTLAIAHLLYDAGKKGAEVRALQLFLSRGVEKVMVLLRFLRLIGVAETFKPRVKGVVGGARWRLTERMTELYKEVLGKE